MKQMDTTPGSDVLHGLRRFATLPDWLAATANPERVSAAMSEEIPELSPGTSEGGVALKGCEVKRMRFKRDRWTSLRSF